MRDTIFGLTGGTYHRRAAVTKSPLTLLRKEISLRMKLMMKRIMRGIPVTQPSAISRRSLLTLGGSLLVAAPLLGSCSTSGGSPDNAATPSGVKKVTTGTVRWLTDSPYKP